MVEGSQAVGMTALFFVGLMGAGHCAGMCGGIVAALGFSAQGKNSARLVIGYNLGRVGSYTVAGALVALLGYWGSTYLALGPWLRIAAGIFLVLMGLYLGNWWNGLVYLEKFGSRLWRLIQPLGKRLLPPSTIIHAVLLGMLWGWLPCGLVYSALAYAATASNPLEGALSMAAFGLGTAPAMVLGGFFSERARHLLQRRGLRRVMAVAMIAFGAWTLVLGAQPLPMHDGVHAHGQP